MSTQRTCGACGADYEPHRWPLDTALLWVEDCLRWRGGVLHGEHVHWCIEWDGLPVDETTDEHSVCRCFAANPDDGRA